MVRLIKYGAYCLLIIFLVFLISPILVGIWVTRLFNPHILPKLAYHKVWQKKDEALGGKE